MPLHFTKHSENNVYPLRRSYPALKMFSIIHAKNLVKYEPIQGQASGMDGTLTLIFAISKTIRDSKKFIKEH